MLLRDFSCAKTINKVFILKKINLYDYSRRTVGKIHRRFVGAVFEIFHQNISSETTGVSCLADFCRLVVIRAKTALLPSEGFSI